MSDVPPLPTNPAELKAWVEGLSADQLQAMTQQITSGAFTRGFAGRLPDFDRSNPEIELPPPAAEPSLLTLTIELRGSKPRIWRRLVLPGDLTLDVVHTLFQAAMGWSDSHLHRFRPGTGRAYDQPFFLTEYDVEEGEEGTREDAVRLDQVLCAPGDRMTYLYDFGDDWVHRVTLESVDPLPPGGAEPTCLGGARACPPEDVGGIGGHHDIAVWLRAGAPADQVPDPFDDAEDAHRWLPVDYDPDAFDAGEATAAMHRWASGEHLPWHALPEPLVALILAMRGQGWAQANAWLAELGPRQAVVLDDDAVRLAAMPWLAVLQAVGPGIKLTAAGYLPPAVVQQIARDTGVTVGRFGRTMREDSVWPVAALREAAQQTGLLRKAKGQLTPTARARAVADNPRGLIAAVLGRLPLGKGFDADAGWFALLGLAAGKSGDALDEGVAQMLTDRGWRISGDGVGAADARGGASGTVLPLRSMAGGLKAADPTHVRALARAALFGLASPG